MMPKKALLKKYGLVFLTLWGLLLFLSLNKHSHAPLYSYQSELWADKAGYYVYLPAALIYGMDARAFPDSIVQKTGEGFALKGSKVITKYSYGVALMEAPFFFMAHLLSPMMGYDADGFGLVYQKFIDVAGVSYSLMAFFFLFFLLRRRFALYPVVWGLSLIFLATNVFYYSIDETGMSHIYSFFLFAVFLYLLDNLRNKGPLNRRLFGLLVLGCFIFITRPTDFIFLLGASYIFLSREDWKKVLDFVGMKQWILAVLLAFLVFLPQGLYWKYAYGSFWSYSYGQESFDWLHPQLLKTWFSTDNGLFVYTPFFFLVLISFVWLRGFGSRMVRTKISSLLVFLILSYVLSCWWFPSFGCSFGARNFVEFYALFSISLVASFQKLWKSHIIFKTSVGLLSLFCILWNIVLSYHFDQCYMGHGDRDWEWVLGLFHI